VALSGWIYDTENHKFGLSKSVAATRTSIVKREFIVLPGPSGTVPHHLPYELILSKGNLLPCSIIVERCHTIWQILALSQRNSDTLSHKFGIDRINLCHSVWYCPNWSLPRNLALSKVIFIALYDKNWFLSEEISVIPYWTLLRDHCHPA